MGTAAVNCNTQCCHAEDSCRGAFLPREYEPQDQPECAREYEEPALPKTVSATSSRAGPGFAPAAYYLTGRSASWEAWVNGDRQAEEDAGGARACPAPEISRVSSNDVSRPDGARESYFTRELAEPVSAIFAAGHADGWRQKYYFMTGSTYEGQWLGTARNGWGVQSWPDGTRYHGEWNDSLAEGKGEFVHADGDVYIGQWKASVAHGQGVYYDSQGLSTYGGEWGNDLQHGCGIELWDGGAKYRGQFLLGKKHGHGMYSWPDGSTYHGEWKLNKIHGAGHYTGCDGREFRGLWRDSMIHGCGEYKWPDGRAFYGQYENDHKEGFGIFTWPDGRRFEGYWHEGKQHGAGVTYLANGMVLNSGDWAFGECVRLDEYPDEDTQDLTENSAASQSMLSGYMR